MSASILYIPHGGGPLPLMGHPGHTALTEFLKTIPTRIPQPEAINVVYLDAKSCLINIEIMLN